MSVTKARLVDGRRRTHALRAIAALLSSGWSIAGVAQMVGPTPQSPGVPVTAEEAEQERDTSRLRVGISLVLMLVIVVIASASRTKADDITRTPGQSYDWTGFYFGGHLDVAWGKLRLDSGDTVGIVSLRRISSC